MRISFHNILERNLRFFTMTFYFKIEIFHIVVLFNFDIHFINFISMSTSVNKILTFCSYSTRKNCKYVNSARKKAMLSLAAVHEFSFSVWFSQVTYSMDTWTNYHVELAPCQLFCFSQFFTPQWEIIWSILSLTLGRINYKQWNLCD